MRQEQRLLLSNGVRGSQGKSDGISLSSYKGRGQVKQEAQFGAFQMLSFVERQMKSVCA
jgi:hypothetical protein